MKCEYNCIPAYDGGHNFACPERPSMDALDELYEGLRQAWACIEHIKEYAPLDLKESAIATMEEIEFIMAREAKRKA